MKYQVGDVFIQEICDNKYDLGTLTFIVENFKYPYYIEWSLGTKGCFKEEEIDYWIKQNTMKYYPVVK